jgi:hypothetical protein
MIDRRSTLAGLAGAALSAAAGPSFARAVQPRLGGRSNYRMALAEGCGAIANLAVTIDVTQDIVVKKTNPQNGFNFQLNCYSDQARSAWQQYIVGLLDTDLHCKVQNFRSTNPNQPMTSMVNQQFTMATLQNLTLPAGFKITTALQYGAGDMVTGADFTIVRRNGQTLQKRVMLADLGLKPAQMAPIVAFELVLVGPHGGHTAALTSGGGSFAYSAAAPLAAGATLPDCVAHQNGTAEQSNSVYGPLPARPGASFSQTFSVAG